MRLKAVTRRDLMSEMERRSPQSFENTVRVKCSNCDWDVVWHHFIQPSFKDLVCEDCGAAVEVKPISMRNVTRLGVNHDREKVIRTHYNTKGIGRKIGIL